jgi:hypothetical protein
MEGEKSREVALVLGITSFFFFFFFTDLEQTQSEQADCPRPMN